MTPIYRAKKIDSDEYAVGCLNIWEQNGELYYSIMEIGKYPSPFNNIHMIDQSTLSISFDDGKSFLKLSDLDIKTCKTFDMVYDCEKNRQHREKQMGTGKIYTIITDKG